MYRLIKSLIYLILGIPLTVWAEIDTNGIKFVGNLSWEEVKAKAEKEKKYIFIDVNATWCVPCKVMDREVFQSPLLDTLMSGKFISLKLQLDKTKLDNDQVKRWYAIAEDFTTKYQINTVPTFLFFSHEAKLIYKTCGYKDLNGFVKLISDATNPGNLSFYKQLQDYESGKRDYQNMYSLIMTSKQILGDEGKILTMVKDFKDNHLDKLDSKRLTQKWVFDFISTFPSVLKSSDVLFNIITSNPGKSDSIMGYQGWAERVKSYIIKKEEIMSYIFSDDKWLVPKTASPDWNIISENVSKKYGDKYRNLVISSQLYFYTIIKDWRKFADIRETKTRIYPLKVSNDIYADDHPFLLNDDAWTVFLHCSDTLVLKRALDWIDLSIRLEDNEQYLDTKANLLYKLGRVNDAIATEYEAINMGKERFRKLKLGEYNSTEYEAIIDKMKRGVPTWEGQ